MYDDYQNSDWLDDGPDGPTEKALAFMYYAIGIAVIIIALGVVIGAFLSFLL